MKNNPKKGSAKGRQKPKAESINSKSLPLKEKVAIMGLI